MQRGSRSRPGSRDFRRTMVLSSASQNLLIWRNVNENEGQSSTGGGRRRRLIHI